MTRLLSISLSCLLAICSALALFKRALPDNQGLDRFLRHTWIYKDDDLVRNARAQLMKDGPEALATALDYSTIMLVRDSASPYRWRDMGKALAQSGQIDKAIYCYRRSVELGPNNPTTLVRAATFFFTLNRPLDALPYYCRTLQLIPNWDANIFETYWRMRVNLLDILKLGIGVHRRPAEAYIHYILAHPQSYPVRNIQAAWNWVDSHSLADDHLTADYIDFLLKNRLYDNAASVWARHLGDRKSTYLTSNYLANSSFEYDFSGTVLDWRVTPAAGASVERDPAVSQSGKYSLRIQFTGQQNIRFQHVSQTAIVKPGKYRFETYIRTDKISTDQGVGFRILDRQQPSRLNVRIGNITGTNDWTRVGMTLTVPQDTNLLLVEVVRDPSAKFDDQIHGTAWVDSVALTLEK